MNVYMVQNKNTGEWWGNRGWEDRQSKASIWNSRRGPGGIKGRYQKVKHEMQIVTFELEEIGRD